MASDMLTFNPGSSRKIFRAGDIIKFYPQIQINDYNSSSSEEPYLQHVIYDIYRFRFKPIARYFNNEHESKYKNCYHYLIEIFPDLKLFCFNWANPYQSYLKIGQWYEGHGQLRNCGNAAEYNECISPLIMKGIFRTGKLTGIYENLLWRDFRKDTSHKIKHFRYSEDVYGYEDVLDAFGYDKNLEKFNVNISRYKEDATVFNSTDEIPAGAAVTFCVDILDQ